MGQVSHKNIFSALPALWIAISYCINYQPSQAADSGGHARCTADILINATPKVVWQAVHEERNQDPELAYSHVLSCGGHMQMLEQKFIDIPLLGSATAVTRQNEEPYRRIDYSLISSDKFKQLDGSWELTPVSGGRATILRLSSHLDIGVPFSGLFIRNATQRKINSRIANVKRLAEQEQSRLAASGQSDL